MNKKISIALVTLFMPPLFGTIERISDKESLKKIIPALKVLAPSTELHDNSKLPTLPNDPNAVFIAKMDSFGLDRYFSFETEEDAKSLVEAVRNGAGYKVSWYYLEMHWFLEKLDSLTIENKETL